jgi:hypothetical protein
MTLQAVSGPGASVVKYDLLTALSLAGLRKGGTFQQSVLRLMVLITARYNWRHDELSMGQADIARLWSVDIRTVKREMKRLTQHEFLFLKRPARRGRVAAYGLNRAAILALSEDDWKDVGPDYVSRMTGHARQGNVVPVDFKMRNEPDRSEPGSVPTDEPADDWDRMRRVLGARDPAICASWFDPLRFLGLKDGYLVLEAPSRFVASYVTTHHEGAVCEAAHECGFYIKGVRVSSR